MSPRTFPKREVLKVKDLFEGGRGVENTQPEVAATVPQAYAGKRRLLNDFGAGIGL